MSLSELEPDVTAIHVDAWKPWFAWRPVKLYMTRRFTWLRFIHRRTVLKTAGGTCEYTDDTECFPDLPQEAATQQGAVAQKEAEILSA